ncbi:signal peptide peptidase SppA [Marinomonas sp. C2222]|uniref:Signal peptide peptidase SppA n=1 Tax=Marinomonas sargassi TaxID=2984494 RepID=A0ABT2YSG2_9GAMM|nr:signal peptide peptidase SppA [Marinomonas sargassi]MCV2402811.1 signal peptide peptidase SppA [Marinomonas sargassi]
MSWTEEEEKKQTEVTEGEAQEKEPVKKDLVDPNSAIWGLLEKTLNENLVEKRRARRWKIFFRSISFAIVLSLLGSWLYKSNFDEVALPQDVVAMLPMRGVIGAEADIESYEFVGILNNAYQNSRLQGVVIEMNSPGGSPVHSGIIYDAIMDKRQEYPDIPVIVVVEDMAASGGYYIASAATEIYADKASLVGSIGVISSGFDASNLLEKIGVERRTFTAGRNKAFLDPFSPMTEEAQEKWQSVLDETHKQFISAVKEGRGDRLIINEDVFSGMVFTGTQAIEIGLVDGLSSVSRILEKRFPDAEPVFYKSKKQNLEDFVKELGVEMVHSVFNKISLN